MIVVESLTKNRTVGHFVPDSEQRNGAVEEELHRIVCSRANAGNEFGHRFSSEEACGEARDSEAYRLALSVKQ